MEPLTGNRHSERSLVEHTNPDPSALKLRVQEGVGAVICKINGKQEGL